MPEPQELPSLHENPELATTSTLPEAWKVDLPIFEGPLDLQLHLIKVEQIDVYDIPVARICDQFHEYLALLEELDLDVAAEFIYEAALLIQLKSRLLLPRPTREDGEPLEDDPRDVLVQRLLEYRRLKEAAQELGEVDRLRIGLWTRKAGPPDFTAEDEEIDLGELSLFDLLAAFKRVLVRYDKEHPPPMVLEGESFSVRDQLHRLLRLLAAGRPYDLLDDLRLLTCRAEAIAAFLAVLEMAKLNLVRVHQTEKGEVLLYRTTREIQKDDMELIDG